MSEVREPSYYSIIPSTVRYDTRLRLADRLMYGEITALIRYTLSFKKRKILI